MGDLAGLISLTNVGRRTLFSNSIDFIISKCSVVVEADDVAELKGVSSIPTLTSSSSLSVTEKG